MKQMSAIVAVVVLLVGAVWWVSRLAPSEPVTIENPRIRLVPGGAPMAGYMVVRNHGDGMIRLTGAASEAFGRVMIHRSVVEDGRARMEHQAGGVSIAPGETVEFKPRGLHLMLMQPAGGLEVGDSVDVALTFDGLQPAERLVAFTVVPVTAE